MGRLALFDIDGTLIRTDGVGTSAIHRALSEIFDCELRVDGYVLSGKTDTQICLELMEAHGFTRDAVLDRLEAFRSVYVDRLTETLAARPPTVLPGVPTLLERLSYRDDVVLGLLTGNIERVAWMKLSLAGLDGHFAFGAFGDCAASRDLLPPIAVGAAKVTTGLTYAGKDIVIVGDTPNDIRCGASLGVTAVAVATGRYTVEELEEAGADHVFDNLNEVEGVIYAMVNRT